jgi:hypothetical protein
LEAILPAEVDVDVELYSEDTLTITYAAAANVGTKALTCDDDGLAHARLIANFGDGKSRVLTTAAGHNIIIKDADPSGLAVAVYADEDADADKVLLSVTAGNANTSAVCSGTLLEFAETVAEIGGALMDTSWGTIPANFIADDGASRGMLRLEIELGLCDTDLGNAETTGVHALEHAFIPDVAAERTSRARNKPADG